MRFVPILGLAVILAACGSGADAGSDQSAEIEGTWLYVAYTEDGVEHEVVVGSNAESQPYVTIGSDLQGNAGCNGFGSDYTFADGVLTSQFVIESSRCEPEEHMQAEFAWERVVWGEDPVQVLVDGDTMTWSANGSFLTFVTTTEPPP